MKAAIVESPGATPVLGTFRTPEAEAGEHLVAVTAAALSPLTRGRAAGTHYSSSFTEPFVPGVDGVGRLPDGRRVYFAMPRAPFGAMAERTAVPARRCVALPDDLDDAAAAAIANPGMSSWAALTERAELVAGETVLVNGATGAAGRLAVRIARHLGAAKVIATGRDPAALSGLDADATMMVGGDETTMRQEGRHHFAAGIDVVLDYLWGPSARALLVAAAETMPEARPLRFVQIGAASGGEIALPAAMLRSQPITLMGSGIGSVSTDRLLAAIGGVFGAARAAGLDTDHRCLPLEEIETSWNDPAPRGRLVYRIDGAA